mgnify:CR=1 FL=1
MAKESGRFNQSTIEQINRRTYSYAAIMRLYTDEKWLPSEASVLLDYGGEIVSKRVLELGAGSGRIASVLQNRAAYYCATDINPDMISTLCAVHLNINAKVADARYLGEFQDGSFDTVIFSFNGIDCLPFQDRPKALSEIYRVLSVGGIFIHSTHNVAHAHLASNAPSLFNSGNSIVESLHRKWNRFRLSRFEFFSPEYAIVNDRALNHGLLNVYIKPDIHFAQMSEVGFSIEAVYERDGRKLQNWSQITDQWYYVVGRK